MVREHLFEGEYDEEVIEELECVECAGVFKELPCQPQAEIIERNEEGIRHNQVRPQVVHTQPEACDDGLIHGLAQWFEHALDIDV